MNLTKIFKALANETRLEILQWLKEPKKHFVFKSCDLGKANIDMDEVGVCVGLIQYKAELSQSTISQYLSILEDAGLIKAQRIGQWTYYQRNEETLKKFSTVIKQEL